MAAASQPRSPDNWRLTGRLGPSGPSQRGSLQAVSFDLRARLWAKLEQELNDERARIEKRRDEDRRIDNDRLARIERDIHDMRNLIFAAFQRKNGD